jgi:hypothetical protein
MRAMAGRLERQAGYSRSEAKKMRSKKIRIKINQFHYISMENHANVQSIEFIKKLVLYAINEPTSHCETYRAEMHARFKPVPIRDYQSEILNMRLSHSENFDKNPITR